MSDVITLVEFCSPEVVTTRNGMDANGKYHADQNKQLHENSSRSQQLAQEYLTLDGSFHNTQPPNLVIQHEKAQHRLVLLFKLRGMSNREIARELEMSESWISQVTRQPWFQAQLTTALESAEAEVIDKIVKVEAVNSIYKLVSLRDTAVSESVQADCAKEILNRHLGKTVQRTEIQSNVFHVSAKLDDIDRQLKEVEEEENRLRHIEVTSEPTSPDRGNS